MQIKVKVDDQTNVAIRELEEAIDKGLDDVADFIFERSQALVPRDEATLANSALPINRSFLEKEVIYRALHAGFVEFGTDPRERMPPVDVIERWVIRKGIASGKNARAAAWAISKSIQKTGTRPQPYLRPAVNEASTKADDIMRNAVNEGLNSSGAKK